jgi:copper chaperone
MTTRFRVPDASCGHCKSTIEAAVNELGDVNAAELDLGSNTISVEHGESLSGDDIAGAISRAGYTPEPVE